MRRPFETRPARPLVDWLRLVPDFFRTALRTCGLATPPTIATSATATTGITARRCHSTGATISTAATRPANDYCEYESRSPTQQTTSAPAAIHAFLSEFPRTTTTSAPTIAITRKRP